MHAGASLLRTRPRLIAAFVVGVATFLVLPAAWMANPLTRALVAWNVFVGVDLLLAVRAMREADAQEIARRALAQTEGQNLLLMLVGAAAGAVLLAVASQLADGRALHGAARVAHVALTMLTVASAWTFIQVMFALHYAHAFYVARARGADDPLDFPGTAHPRYGDFVYFAFVIGTSGQTADVAFRGSRLRAVGTVHGVLAFAFNTVVLALTINVAAGLF